MMSADMEDQGSSQPFWMEILKNLVLEELTASEKADESSCEIEIPVGADMVVVEDRERNSGGRGG